MRKVVIVLFIINILSSCNKELPEKLIDNNNAFNILIEYVKEELDVKDIDKIKLLRFQYICKLNNNYKYSSKISIVVTYKGKVKRFIINSFGDIKSYDVKLTLENVGGEKELINKKDYDFFTFPVKKIKIESLNNIIQQSITKFNKKMKVYGYCSSIIIDKKVKTTLLVVIKQKQLNSKLKEHYRYTWTNSGSIIQMR